MLRQIKQAWFSPFFLSSFHDIFSWWRSPLNHRPIDAASSAAVQSLSAFPKRQVMSPITHEGVTLIGCTVYNPKRDGLFAGNTIYWFSGVCAHSTGCEERCSSLSLVDWNTEQGRGQDIDEFDENEICWSYICYMKTGRRKAGGLVAIYECDEWWTRRGRGGWDEK